MSKEQFDNYFLAQEEPFRSCLLALKDIILSIDKNLVPCWKYRMPFFCYKGKMFCYVWVHKKYEQPYLGIVQGKYIDHPDLIMEERAKMKIMLLDPAQDLPIKTIKDVLKQALELYTPEL